jgi:hypothetical protein
MIPPESSSCVSRTIAKAKWAMVLDPAGNAGQ